MYLEMEEAKGRFMQPEVIGPLTAFEVDTSDGTIWVDRADTGLDLDDNKGMAEFLGIPEYRIYEYTSHSNYYLARLSAPGYLDATDWCGFATLEEAEEYLRERYIID